MNIEEGFALRGRNPDVLTCIANLSNDEVFTPPEFANRMLDTVAAAWAADHDGADIWANRTVKFLDPCTKSGVFLREVTKRLIAGLESEIPDLQERVDHILTRQVFGIGSTLLTRPAFTDLTVAAEGYSSDKMVLQDALCKSSC